MKSTINIFFGVLFILFACTQNVSAFTGLGAGTELDPYQITTCAQLQEIDDERSASYLLMNDIDCTETATWNENVDEWVDGIVDGTLIPDSYASTTGTDIIVQNNGYFGFEPIGYSGTSSEALFTGTLDGDGHTISNLWIFRKNETNVGIFGMTSAATIRDLGLRDSNIVGQYSVGGVVGSMNGGTANNIALQDNMVRAYLSYQGGGFAGEMLEGVVAENITNTGGVVHGSGSVIGGIVGKMVDATINNSHSSADVDGGDQIGGFVGAMDSSNINNSYATGNVRSDRLESPIVKSGNNVGGFVGYMNGGIIDTSYATGDVEVTGNYGGGFAGSVNGSAQVEDSYSTGNVTGTQETIGETTYEHPYSIGGFAGEIHQSTISDAYATGDVVNSGERTGGFVGNAVCTSEITYSYASGDVTGDMYVGGFVGDAACEGPSTTFSQVSAKGNVTGDEHVGGFAGRLVVSTVTDGYASGSVTGGTYVGGFAGELNYTDTNNVYSRGVVTGSGEEYVGAFVGKNFNDGEAIEGFWNTTAVGSLPGCGAGIESECDGVEGKDIMLMKTQSTFEDAGYNFEDVWGMDGYNQGYPHFLWESFVDEEYELLTLSVTDITKTSAVLRGRVVSGTFEQFGLGFAFASTTLDDAPDSVLLIGPADEYDQETGEYIKDLAVYDFNPEEVLTCGTTYYYSAIGFIGIGGPSDLISANNELSFTTRSCNDEVVESRSSSRNGSRRRVTSQSNSLFSQTPKVETTIQDSGSANSINSGTPITVRDLTLTFSGADVTKLQQILITKNSGPKAQALLSVGATGYFGTYTRDALAEYQLLNSISPAIGYFGSITRAQMKSAGLEGLWW